MPLWSPLRAGARRDDHWRFSGLALALAQTVTGPPALLGASAAPDSCVRFGVLEGETLRFGVLRKGERGAGAALGGLYGAAGCAAALQALDIACGAVCGVLASITPGPASGTAEIDARRALRRRLEAIADSGGDDAATARTAAARLAPPRPPPPPKRRRSAVTDLILGS